jgi:4-amino-4-deoxy-L-arabinose transferase-like glycosyltransferase
MTARILRRDLLLLAAIGFLLFAPGIGSRELWNPDEPRYAEVAREMLEGGEWFVPHLNGDIYTQKPPLLFWAIALAGSLIGGVGPVAARLPSLLAAIAALLATYRLAADAAASWGDAASRRTAWLAALLFGGSAKILWQARVGQIDMLLIALVAWAFWCWFRSVREDKSGWALLGFALAGLGTIAKGPVSLLPPLFGWLLFALWQRDMAVLKRLRIGWGLAIYAATVLLWLLPAAWVGGGDYIQQIAFKQTVTRYADPWHHFQPWYYYLTVLPVDFFPASLLLPVGLVAGFRHLAGEPRRWFRLFLCWAVATLLFFSLSPAKRTVYILTLYPGLAVALALGLQALDTAWIAARARAERFRLATAWWVPFAVLAALFLLAAVAAPAVASRRVDVVALGPGLGPLAATLAALAALGCAWALHRAWRGDVLRAVAGWTVALGVAVAGASWLLLPRLDPVKSPRLLAQTFLTSSRAGEPYTMYPRFDANVLFHVRRWARVVDDEAELRAFLTTPGRSWLFAKRDALAKLENLPAMTEIAADPDTRRGYVLWLREAAD